MYTHTHKLSPHTLSRQTESRQPLGGTRQFIDNRSAVVQQRQQQASMYHSPRREETAQLQALLPLKPKVPGVDKQDALKPIRKQPRVLIQREVNNVPGVIQRRLERGLNVVGELHNETKGATEDAERRYVKDQLGEDSGFWLEGEFAKSLTLSLIRGKQYGDPIKLRALNHFAYLRENCRGFVQGVGARPRQLLPGELRDFLSSMSGNITNIRDNLYRGGIWRFNGLSYFDLGNLRQKIQKDGAKLDEHLVAKWPGGKEYARQQRELGVPDVLINRHLMPMNERTRQERIPAAYADLDGMLPYYQQWSERFDRIVQRQHRAVNFIPRQDGSGIYDSEYENQVSIARSMAMHKMANRCHATVGVWKIGNRHVEHILNRQDHGGDPEIKYNLLTRDDFRQLVPVPQADA